MDGSCETPVTSRLSSDPSAAGDVRRDVLASSQTAVWPFVSAASQQSKIQAIQTTAPLESVAELTVGCAAVSLEASESVDRSDPCCEVVHQPKSAWTSLNTSLLRAEATGVPQSSSGVDRSICADSRSSSPVIDVLPVVKRVKTAADNNSTGSSAGEQSLQWSGVRSDDGVSAVGHGAAWSTVYRCGSPGLDEDGEFSHHRSKPAAVTHSQSSAARGVKLIPLSQVMSSSISSDNAAERLSAKISRVDKISTEAADDKFFSNQKLSRSSPTLHQQHKPLQVTKIGRRRSTRLRVPDSTLGCAEQHAVEETKTVKFSVSLSNTEPTDKENVYMQRAVAQPTVSCRQPLQQESEEIPCPSAKSHTSSCNSSFSGEESEVSVAKVRRSFIKCARQDVESTDRLRLPTAWERHTKSSPAASRRMSDRIKQKRSDTQRSDSQKSPPTVAGIKRSASSSSSGLSSCEKKSAKKMMRTIAMTSLHSELVTFVILQYYLMLTLLDN